MISSNFYTWLTIVTFIYFYSEFFCSTLINSLFKNLKQFNIQLSKKNKNLIFSNNCYKILIGCLILFFISFKSNYSNYLVSYVIVYTLLSKYINTYFENYINFLNLNIIMFINLFYFINNYVTFYIIIELYAVIFYFFF